MASLKQRKTDLGLIPLNSVTSTCPKRRDVLFFSYRWLKLLVSHFSRCPFTWDIFFFCFWHFQTCARVCGSVAIFHSWHTHSVLHSAHDVRDMLCNLKIRITQKRLLMERFNLRRFMAAPLLECSRAYRTSWVNPLHVTRTHALFLKSCSHGDRTEFSIWYDLLVWGFFSLDPAESLYRNVVTDAGSWSSSPESSILPTVYLVNVANRYSFVWFSTKYCNVFTIRHRACQQH